MKYQQHYSKTHPEMFDTASRIQKAKQLIKIIKDYPLTDLKKLTVLDVGCSSGIIDNYLADYFKQLTGIDIDQTALNFAQVNFKKANLKFKKADSLKLPFKDSYFDLVICAQTYEHVPDSQKMFNELYRVLREGGILFLSAMNKYTLVEPHHKLPFLSFLPKKLANYYLQLFKKLDYYETPKSYFQLKKELARFKLTDYTGKIIAEPGKYGYSSPKIIWPFSQLLKYLSPSFIWVLKK